MKKNITDKLSDKIVSAFIKGKLIAPLPKKYTKKLFNAEKFRRICESKIKDHVIGFKAAGTGIPAFTVAINTIPIRGIPPFNCC